MWQGTGMEKGSGNWLEKLCAPHYPTSPTTFAHESQENEGPTGETPEKAILQHFCGKNPKDQLAKGDRRTVSGPTFWEFY